MRVVFSIPKHRLYMYTGTPSEPILAEAAARLMLKFGQEETRRNPAPSDLKTSVSRGAALKLLRGWVSGGLLEKGELGELVARTLLTFAHDLAIEEAMEAAKEKPEGLDDPDPMFSKPILVADFLRALLRPSYAEDALNYRPENDPNGQTLREAFKDAYVHFTHFGRTQEAKLLIDEAALYAMCRGMGWTFYRQQRGVDIGIPVFLRIPGDPLNRYRMTMIFIQVKNKPDSEELVIDMESPQFKTQFFTKPPNGVVDNRPYIVIVMNLGVRAPPLVTVGGEKGNPVPKSMRPYNDQQTPSKVSTRATSERVQPERAAKGRPRPKHPRYAFALHGCSSTLYRVIDETEDKHVYAEILNSRTMLSEHPRPDDDCRNLVENLKPGWSCGEAYFGWVEPDGNSDVLPSQAVEGGADRAVLREGVTLEERSEDEDASSGSEL